MDAVVLAGGVPKPEELLYAYTHGQPKALLPMAGKPMAQWVLDALSASPAVERIVMIGLPETEALHSPKITAFLPNEGSLLANILAGLRFVRQTNPQAEYTLLASSDIPALRPEMVDWVAAGALRLQAEVIYHVVTRETMEERFPDAKRTYLRLKDMEVCGADLNVVRTDIVDRDTTLASRVLAARKNPLRQAAFVGWKTLLMVALHRWTLEQTVAAVSARSGLHGVGVVSPYAEMAMDADKPHQVDLLRADLARYSHSEVEHD